MAMTEIRLRGKVFRISIDEDPTFVANAVAATEDYLDAVSKATSIQDAEQLYLLALLNRTMELEKMNKNSMSTELVDDPSIIRWARNLCETLETAAQ